MRALGSPGQIMRRLWWCIRAYLHMRKRIGWARWHIVASIYDTFGEWQPEAAVDEELSYWGD